MELTAYQRSVIDEIRTFGGYCGDYAQGTEEQMELRWLETRNIIVLNLHTDQYVLTGEAHEYL